MLYCYKSNLIFWQNNEDEKIKEKSLVFKNKRSFSFKMEEDLNKTKNFEKKLLNITNKNNEKKVFNKKDKMKNITNNLSILSKNKNNNNDDESNKENNENLRLFENERRNYKFKKVNQNNLEQKRLKENLNPSSFNYLYPIYNNKPNNKANKSDIVRGNLLI